MYCYTGVDVCACAEKCACVCVCVIQCQVRRKLASLACKDPESLYGNLTNINMNCLSPYLTSLDSPPLPGKLPAEEHPMQN